MIETYAQFPVLLWDSLPPEVWTPYGYRKLPDIDLEPMGTQQSLGKCIYEAKAQGKRILTSGEWHQTAVRLIEALPGTEGMISGWKSMERTSTILRYVCSERKPRKGVEYYDGLLIQNPEVDDEGELLRDSAGVLIARDIWEMPLPAKSFYANDANPVFDRFLDTLYGMENARKWLPDTAFFLVIPTGEKGVLWKGWNNEDRFNIDATHEPWVKSMIISSRMCSD